MQKFLDWLSSTDALYFLAGLFSSFATYILRCHGLTGKDFAYRITNALTCVMLSCGVIMTIRLLYGVPYAWSVPIGIAIGCLGSDLILSVVVKIVEFRLGLPGDQKRAFDEQLTKGGKRRPAGGDLEKHPRA